MRTLVRMGLAEELQDETAEVLPQLIRFNTVNPPGNERECQEWLAGYLEDAGLDGRAAGAEPERPNLVATLSGAATGPTLGYLSHVDTVLADAEDWTRRPVGRRDPRRLPLRPRRARHEEPDRRRGRRAAHARPHGGARLSGDAEGDRVADEETGGALGAKWLTEERPDLARVDYLLNEGARRGHALRRPPPVRRLRGREGHVPLQRHAHAAPPGTPRSRASADNALLKLAPADRRARRGPPGLRPHRGHARRCSRRSARTRATRSGALENVARDRAAAGADARRRAARHVRADASSAPARRST